MLGKVTNSEFMHEFLFLRFCNNFHFRLAITLKSKTTESTLGKRWTRTKMAVFCFPLIPWMKASPSAGGQMIFALCHSRALPTGSSNLGHDPANYSLLLKY